MGRTLQGPGALVNTPGGGFRRTGGARSPRAARGAGMLLKVRITQEGGRRRSCQGLEPWSDPLWYRVRPFLSELGTDLAPIVDPRSRTGAGPAPSGARGLRPEAACSAYFVSTSSSCWTRVASSSRANGVGSQDAPGTAGLCAGPVDTSKTLASGRWGINRSTNGIPFISWSSAPTSKRSMGAACSCANRRASSGCGPASRSV